MTFLEIICERVQRENLPFLLAGGHAVVVHGYARTTFDLDFITDRDSRERWLRVLAHGGLTLYHEGPTFVQFSPPSGQHWPVDLMFVNASTFQKLDAESVTAEIGRASVKVVSLLHLIALKCHAIRHGHSGRVIKDTDDLVRLIEVNRLQVEEPKLREIVLQHGSAEIYEKLRRIFPTG